MSEQSLELLVRIRRRLRHAARRITLADLLYGLVLSAGILSALWVLSAAVEAGFWMGTNARTMLFWTLAAVAVGLTGTFLAVPLLRLAGIVHGPSPDDVADAVGRRFPEIGDRLVDLLDLSEGRRSDAPDALVDGAVRMLGREVEPVSFDGVADFSRARRATRAAALPLASLLLFVAAAPATFFGASQRLLSPGIHFERPAPFQLHVVPGDVEVARGEALEIRIRAVGNEIPTTLALALNNVGEDHVETIRLTADSSGVFHHVLANVRRSVRYRVAAEPVTSRWYEATVTEHPLVRSLQVELAFPAYAGMPPQRLDPNVGDVAGLPGTRVHLDVTLGGSDAASGVVRFDDGSSTPLDLDGDAASGTFTLSREGSYHIVVTNARGVDNRDPIRYTMRRIEDAVPSVVILRPESDAALNEALRPTVESRISDDYGFHDLALFYRLSESRFGQTSETFDRIDLPLDDPRLLDQEVPYLWRIAEVTDLDLVPGDVVEYFVRVRDNDAVAGYKAADTPMQLLRLPSLAEQYEQMNAAQEEAKSQMEEALDETRRLDEQFRELRDAVRRKQDGDWEDKRQLEQMQESQRQLENRVDDLARQMDAVNQSAEQNDLLSDETLQMYEEMQRVVEEINSPELRQALQQLQQSMENLDLSQMQQAIENFEFNEQEYQQRLERALELFKNLRAQQRLEEAARRAEELARQQEELAERTAELQRHEAANDETPPEESGAANEADADDAEEGERRQDPAESSDPSSSPDRDDASQDRAPPDDARRQAGDREASEEARPPDESGSDDAASPQEQLARQQELSSDEMRQLEDFLREAQEQLDQLRQGPSERMQELNQSLQQQQMPRQMQENAQQLRQQQFQNAQSGQQQMQQQLQQLQQQLSQMQSSMQGSQMQVNLAGLRRALSDVLTLSQDQEGLRTQLRTNVSEAPSLREDARRQVELSEGLSTVIDSLQELGKSMPQLSREVQRLSGQALREMGSATTAMTERAAGEAAGYQTGSMMNLNELALLLSDVMNQMMNQSGSGSGEGSMQQMIQQLQDMAQQQGQLNRQIQDFLNDVQGNRLNVDMQQRLQQMGAQQQAIKRQLDEIRRNPEARGQLLGDLGRIAEQMEETIAELQRRQVEPRTIERQRQILQRLLDAQRSLNERGREQRREAQEGQDVDRESPADLPPDEAVDRLRRDLIRALESGYAPDYEELIKRYFELLQQQTVEPE